MIGKLLRSPLFETIREYLNQAKVDEQIFLYVPYIKTKTLEKLLEITPNQVIIITTWHINDLISGSSELELYEFCKEHNITLYINNKIHLKVYSVKLDSAIIASGNISHRGLMPGGNYEVGTFAEKLTNQDRMYLEKIKRDAIFVNDEVYQKYLEAYEKCKKEAPEQIEFEDPVIISKKDYFLKSALPMTRNMEELIEGYVKINSNLEPSDNPETSACIYHDLANYEIETGLSKEEFIENLKIQFFAHPFTKKIDEFINPEAYFGSIKEWVQSNCTDVPLPKKWELTENVQALYDWFERLGDGKYVIDVPGSHSQRIRKITTDVSIESSNELNEYDKAVLDILASPGETIKQIEEQYANMDPKRTIHDNPSELENASESIWHYKIKTDERVIGLLSLSGDFIDKKDASGKTKLYRKVVAVIEKLNKLGSIVVWYNDGSTGDGIWRLR